MTAVYQQGCKYQRFGGGRAGSVQSEKGDIEMQKSVGRRGALIYQISRHYRVKRSFFDVRFGRRKIQRQLLHLRFGTLPGVGAESVVAVPMVEFVAHRPVMLLVSDHRRGGKYRNRIFQFNIRTHKHLQLRLCPYYSLKGGYYSFTLRAVCGIIVRK